MLNISCSYNGRLTGSCFNEQCPKKLPGKISLISTQSTKNWQVFKEINIYINELKQNNICLIDETQTNEKQQQFKQLANNIYERRQK